MGTRPFAPVIRPRTSMITIIITFLPPFPTFNPLNPHKLRWLLVTLALSPGGDDRPGSLFLLEEAVMWEVI